MIYEVYGFIHKSIKKLLKRCNDLSDNVKFVSFPESTWRHGKLIINNADYVNDTKVNDKSLKIADVYPVENLVNSDFDAQYPLSFQKEYVRCTYASSLTEAASLWPRFIDASVIPEGYRNAGLHYAGYIKEYQEWCLPSWIWTNAAMVRYFCSSGKVNKAKELGDLLISQQQECGGWIVRNDYSRRGISPQLAPNDSCYIALNCCLILYEATKEKKYLDSAIKCAEWTAKTSRYDGLVWFAFDMKKNEWIKNKNIVDIGFTAGLFARLYEITRNDHYRFYLQRFIKSYIHVFYMFDQKCFSTTVDNQNRQFGGAFGRGQGWALEGLIPAYRVLKQKNIRKVITDTIETILRLQLNNGGWSYNLLNPMMGEDCKAVPIIAKCLLDWYKIDNRDIRLVKAAKKAMIWCAKHTATSSSLAGGIFSYTIEGAVVHHMYTNTAFVYASSYALEVMDTLKQIEMQEKINVIIE